MFNNGGDMNIKKEAKREGKHLWRNFCIKPKDERGELLRDQVFNAYTSQKQYLKRGK